MDVGIGDDAAIVTPPKNAKIAVTTDTLNEGVHFHADHSPEHLGHKALATGLSDLAAMGAEPLWATLNLSLPRIDHPWLEGFARGLFSLADRYDVKIVGGDTIKGYLSVSLQVIGGLRNGEALTRAAAEVDDLIYVSGTVGDAAMGLALRDGHVLNGEMSQTDRDYFAARFHTPDPRVTLGTKIAAFAKAAIDVSDGLLMDLQRVLSASGTGAVIDVGRVPLSAAMQRRFEQLPDWRVPLPGGEDYELVFTVEEGHADRLRRLSREVDCPVTEIGRIVKGKAITLTQQGSPVALPAKLGFDHFV